MQMILLLAVCFVLAAAADAQSSESETRSVEGYRLRQVLLADFGMLVMFVLIWYEFELRRSMIVASVFTLALLLSLNAMWTNFYSVASEPTVIGVASWTALGLCMHVSFAAFFMGTFDFVRFCCRLIVRARRRCARNSSHTHTHTRVRTSSMSEKGEPESEQPTKNKCSQQESASRRTYRLGQWSFRLHVDTFKLAFGYIYVILLSAQGLYVALSRPDIVRVELHFDSKVDGISPSFDGYRIVELADLHLGPSVGASRLAGVVEQVNSLNPDVLVIVGDLVDSQKERLAGALQPLLNLRAPAYYVTGNHEFYYDRVDAWLQLLTDLGVRTLVNDAAVLSSPSDNSSALCLVGMDDLQANRVDYPGHRANFTAAFSRCPPDLPVVLLVHQPRGAQYVLDTADGDQDPLATDYGVSQLSAAERQRRVKLIIAGHTHAGQVAPFSYFGFAAARLGRYAFFNGLYMRSYKLQHNLPHSQLARSYVYVSAGTFYGCIPMRTGSLMEITELTIRVS